MITIWYLCICSVDFDIFGPVENLLAPFVQCKLVASSVERITNKNLILFEVKVFEKLSALQHFAY